MKYILIPFLYLFLTYDVYAQTTMQATIKRGGTPMTVDIYVKPSASFSQKDEAMNLAIAIPAIISPASSGTSGTTPNGTGAVSGISGLLPNFLFNNLGSADRSIVVTTETINGAAHYIYTFVFANTATSNHDWTANEEQLIFSIAFEGCNSNCGITGIKMVNLPNGGSSYQANWYFQSNTIGDITNYPAPFYANPHTLPPVNGGSIDGSVLSFIELDITTPPISVLIPDVKALSTGVRSNTVYPGYTPAAAITLTAEASGGNGTYSYKWSNGATTRSITVSPIVATTYTVIVNDGLLSNSATKQVNVVDVTCTNTSGNRVKVCIVPFRYSVNAFNRCVDSYSVAPLLTNGSHLGDCSARQDGTLTLKAVPNPSFTYFNLTVNSSNANDKITLNVYNVFGKVVESRTVIASTTIQIGASYRPGVYLAEVVQGTRKSAVVLIKMK